jgi:hypothetical protein
MHDFEVEVVVLYVVFMLCQKKKLLFLPVMEFEIKASYLLGV